MPRKNWMQLEELWDFGFFFLGSTTKWGLRRKICKEIKAKQTFREQLGQVTSIPVQVFLERSEAYHSLGLTTATTKLDSNVSVN